MKTTLRTALALLLLTISFVGLRAQDASFSQTYEAPLYLSPSFTGLTNGSRLTLNYRNQWPGVGKAYQDYALAFDHFFDGVSSGLGLMWMCDNYAKGLVIDNAISLLYSYEITISSALYIRPGISFTYGTRKLDQSKMISYSDITSDGKYVLGGSSLDFERTKRDRIDAGASIMLYNNNFWVGATVDHLMRPDASFTDAKEEIGLKTIVYGGYKLVYEESYRGSEPKSITFALDYKNQYSYNQFQVGVYWYYAPIEVGATYRGLFFTVSEEISSKDAIIPNLGINLRALRIGYSYDMTISGISAFGNGAHEISLLYRILPNNIRSKVYKLKPLPCVEPIMGFSYLGKGSKKSTYAKRRAFFKK